MGWAFLGVFFLLAGALGFAYIDKIRYPITMCVIGIVFLAVAIYQSSQPPTHTYTMVVDIHYSASHVVRKTFTDTKPIVLYSRRGTNHIRDFATTAPIEIISYTKQTIENNANQRNAID